MKIKFRVKYKGKFYTSVHTFDIKWDIVTFTGPNNVVISENYLENKDIVVSVKKGGKWINLS